MAAKKASPANSTAKKSTGAEIVAAPPVRKAAVKNSAATVKKSVTAKPTGKAAVKKSAGAAVATLVRKVAAKKTEAVSKAVPVTKASLKKAEKPASAEVAKNKPRKAAKNNTVSPEVRNQMVATAAYFLAEKRGFATGCEIEDWVSAEAKIDLMLAKSIV